MPRSQHSASHPSQGFFLILSCNHDMEELQGLLEPAGLRLHRNLSSQVSGVDPDLTLACFKKPEA